MNEYYREALRQAQIDLTDAELRYEANRARYNECLQESQRLARIVIALAELLKEVPPYEAQAIFEVEPLKPKRKLKINDGRSVEVRRAKTESKAEAR